MVIPGVTTKKPRVKRRLWGRRTALTEFNVYSGIEGVSRSKNAGYVRSLDSPALHHALGMTRFLGPDLLVIY